MDVKLMSKDLGHVVLTWVNAIKAHVPYYRPIGDNVREYVIANKIRQAFSAATAPIPLPPLGDCREIYLYADAKCFFATGNSVVAASAATAHDLGAEERWHLRVPEGHTHFAVVRDSANGTLSIVPVAG